MFVVPFAFKFIVTNLTHPKITPLIKEKKKKNKGKKAPPKEGSISQCKFKFKHTLSSRVIKEIPLKV